ncbi:MAG: SLBB domain-containing protein [Leptolyngbyaceae cyanobacterium MO_188.B28]|nr:SLBB domain-containing protein [Leptolyngbyaceae cyanobacterium MO_188.B28]
MVDTNFIGFSKSIIRPATALALLALTASPSFGAAPIELPRAPAASLNRQPTPPPAPSTFEEAYTLGAGDRIRIDIFRVPQYSGEHEVLIDGSLNLPVAGAVSIQGLTLNQAADAVAAAYGNILRNPRVTVSLVVPRPFRIGVAGEVTSPGSYTLERQGAQFPTVTSIIETAGGITHSADLRQIQVRRPQGSGVGQIIYIDLWEFLQSGDLAYDLTLRDGDTLYIPATDRFSLADAMLLSAASFAANENRPLNIAVVGEVFRPGPYTVTGTASTGAAGETGSGGGSSVPPTVTRAIQVAGGIKPLANIQNIQIRRRTRTGPEQIIDVDLWSLLQTGDIAQDLVLQEGDTVLVPEADPNADPLPLSEVAAASFSPDTMRVNVVGEVNSPGVTQVPPNAPLNQVLLAAGGFNNRARQGKVDLVRLNPDGTATRRKIDVDFTLGVDDDRNPPLQNNDVVIVSRSGVARASDTLGTISDPLSRAFTLISLPLRILGLF